jgi:hypothetical protein
MQLSFGIEASVRGNRWADVVGGPSKEEVLAHVNKIANYQALRERPSKLEASEGDIALDVRPATLPGERRIAA